MTDFSEKDVDRNWAKEELSQLSEKDLTILALHKNIKNIFFFGVGSFVAAWAASNFGGVGITIGWITIVVYGILALEPSLAFLTTIISIVSPMPGKSWKIIQLLIAGISAALFIGFILYIYTSMYNLDIGKYIKF